MTERTLPQLFEDSVAKYPENILMWEKPADAYVGTSYRAMRERVRAFAAGLMELGLGKGDRVALISEGRNDWVMSELGIFYAGAIDVPVSVKIEELADLKFRLAHSGCRMAVVSASQVEKVRRIKHDLPDLERTVVLDSQACREPDEVAADDVLRRGREWLGTHEAEFEARWRSVGEGDPANICYTSGTTADPKGIILTHRNYTANIEQAQSLVPFPESYVSLIILPWDHAFAHTCGIYTMMKGGAALASIQLGKTPMETLKNIPVNIREIRPHFLLSVPSLAKNFRKNIEKGIREKGPKVEALFRKALNMACDYNGDGWDRGKGLKALKKPFMVLYDRLVFSKIRAGLRRPARVLRRRRRPARHRAAEVLLCHRHPHVPGLRADGGGARHLGQLASPSTSSAPRAGWRPGSSSRIRDERRARAARRARRARSSSAARTSWPATGRTRRPRGRPSATAGCTRATSATSTPTASSSSWAG